MKSLRTLLATGVLVALGGLPIAAQGLAEAAALAAKQKVPESSTPAAPSAQLEILEVDARATERNTTWWRYAWKLTLKNTRYNTDSGSRDCPISR